METGATTSKQEICGSAMSAATGPSSTSSLVGEPKYLSFCPLTAQALNVTILFDWIATPKVFNSWDLIFYDVDAYFITANVSFIFSLLTKMYIQLPIIHLPTRSSRFLTPLQKIFQILHCQSWVTKITPWLGTLFLWVRFSFLLDK